MKITFKQLKQIIKEEVNRYRLVEVSETDDTVEGTRDELDRRISSMDPETISDKMYVDSETGEIYLDVGQRACTSYLHPQYVSTTNPPWTNVDDYEDAIGDLNDGDILDEFLTAVRNYAMTLDKGLDVAPEDAAPDMARDWLMVSGWKSRAGELGIPFHRMIEIVQDEFYEALTS